MIVIRDKDKCCGCGACAQICPKHCILMKPDDEGFLYPDVDKSSCVDCGKCEKVCPSCDGEKETSDATHTVARANYNRKTCHWMFLILLSETSSVGGRIIVSV